MPKKRLNKPAPWSNLSREVRFEYWRIASRERQRLWERLNYGHRCLEVLSEPITKDTDPRRPTLLLPGKPSFRQRVLEDMSRRPSRKTIHEAVHNTIKSLDLEISVRHQTIEDYVRYSKDVFASKCDAQQSKAKSDLIAFFETCLSQEGRGWISWQTSEDFKLCYQSLIRALLAPLDLVIESLQGVPTRDLARRQGPGRPRLPKDNELTDRIREIFLENPRLSNRQVLEHAKADAKCLRLVNGDSAVISKYRVQQALAGLRSPPANDSSGS
jgi:hypothetical protein